MVVFSKLCCGGVSGHISGCMSHPEFMKCCSSTTGHHRDTCNNNPTRNKMVAVLADHECCSGYKCHKWWCENHPYYNSCCGGCVAVEYEAYFNVDRDGTHNPWCLHVRATYRSGMRRHGYSTTCMCGGCRSARANRQRK